MSQPFRPHVTLVFFGLEWRLSRELMALDIMTSFHYRSFFMNIFSVNHKVMDSLEMYVPCMKRVWTNE